jgi:endonuclease G
MGKINGLKTMMQNQTTWLKNLGVVAIATTLLLSLTGCPTEKRAVRAPLTGTCECPYDLTRSGQLCGERSAYSRGGGDRPVCYVSDRKGRSTRGNHLLMGNPSNAKPNPGNPNNYLMEKPQYALSYNRSTGRANWVSWQLNSSWLGNADRQDDFRPDGSLPAGFYQVSPSDYRGTGYDRGHIVPSADRTRSKRDNSATFVMTNMMPQSPANNREVWRELEEYSRDLVDRGKELYIIAGSEGKAKTIANGKVTVPQYTWKVIAVLDKPGQGVGDITRETRTIAVRIPNSQRVAKTDWRDYRVSIDAIEAAPGYDFFSNVSRSVQKTIESRVDR